MNGIFDLSRIKLSESEQHEIRINKLLSAIAVEFKVFINLNSAEFEVSICPFDRSMILITLFPKEGERINFKEESIFSIFEVVNGRSGMQITFKTTVEFLNNEEFNRNYKQ